MSTLRITNHTRNSVLATQAQIANTPEFRLRGLIGVTEADFQPGAGLYFPECNAIHTVEMSMPIDVLFIDTLTKRIKKAVSCAAIGRHFNTIYLPREICAVLELPAGVIGMTGTQPGDVVVIMSSTHCSQAELNEVGALRWPVV